MHGRSIDRDAIDRDAAVVELGTIDPPFDEAELHRPLLYRLGNDGGVAHGEFHVDLRIVVGEARQTRRQPVARNRLAGGDRQFAAAKLG
ncbi:hypothetical protein D9M72_567290 [compost metagenome]